MDYNAYYNSLRQRVKPMSHTRLDYAALMHERGFRVTPQRQLILDAIGEGHGHTTFEEIFARVQQKSSAVNRATVYRTLDFLTELRLVVAADVGGGRLVYEIAGETPHHHLICLNCHKEEPLPHSAVAGLFEQIERDHHFHVETNHLALFGYCETCRPLMEAHPHPHAAHVHDHPHPHPPED
jgi:Fur family ferric uptake transcriptional regulator